MAKLCASGALGIKKQTIKIVYLLYTAAGVFYRQLGLEFTSV